MNGENGIARGLLVVSLTFIALMGIYAIWAEEISVAFWKTFLSFAILLVLSLAIQWISRPPRGGLDGPDPQV